MSRVSAERIRAQTIADLCEWMRGFADEGLADDPGQKEAFLGFVAIVERIGPQAVADVAAKRVIDALMEEPC